MEIVPINVMGVRLGAVELGGFVVFGKAADTLGEATMEVERALKQRVQSGMTASMKVMVRTLDRIYAQIREKHGKPWPTGSNTWGTARNILAKRSGEGLKSIKASMDTNIDSAFTVVEGRISTAKLTTHETGARISARNAKYLTIPFRTALDSRGLPLKRSARDWDRTFVRMSRKGNLIIYRKDGSGRVIPLYLLKRSVYIPPRLGMKETVESELPYFEAKALRAIEKELVGWKT